MLDPPIYLDHAATTPLDPDVADAMAPYLTGQRPYGNASSIHSFGRAARAAIDAARDAVATLVDADYSEIYFTGSGTEADNLALIGTLLDAPADRRELVTSSIEHHAVLHTADFLEAHGVTVIRTPPDSTGVVSAENIATRVTDHTTLVSLMYANNEIGTLQPVTEAARAAHAVGALFHTDAVQAGALPDLSFRSIGADLMSLSAHKLYGPQGIGALVIRQGVRVAPIIHGGSQEREKRAGTESVHAMVGFGKAAQLAVARRDTDARQIAALRDYFIAALRAKIFGITLNGSETDRMPGIVNVSIDGLEGPTILMNLDRLGVAASSGSACSSGSIEPSHVLREIGLSGERAASGIRFSLGRGTTQEELERTVGALAAIAERLNRM